MFWKYNFANTSNIDSLLQKENPTLEELMEQDDVVQECQGRNTALVEFLLRPDNLEALVDYVSNEPDDVLEDKTKYKYCNVACELLTCDVPAINEKLAGSPDLLAKLCAFIDRNPPLNPLMASFFSKSMITMVTRKTDENWFSYQFACLQVFDFIKTRESFVPQLVRHIGTSAIMDLVLKLMVYVEGPELRQAFTAWLCEQKLVERLVSCFDAGSDEECHVNVAQLLCDMIGVCRGDLSVTRSLPGPVPNVSYLNGGSNGGGLRGDSDALTSFAFLRELESKEIVTLLFDRMLGGKELSPTAIICGMNVIIALLDIQKSCVLVPDDDSGHVSDSPPGEKVANVDIGLGDDGRASLEEPKAGPVVEEKEDSSPSPSSSASSTSMWKLHPSVRNVVEALTPWLAKIHSILLSPPEVAIIRTTAGVLDPPLGHVRLQIVRLVASLVSLKYRPISEKLAELGTLKVLVDLFFKYPWNNFLHSHIESIVMTLLSSVDSATATASTSTVGPKIVEIVSSKGGAGDESPENSEDGSSSSSPIKTASNDTVPFSEGDRCSETVLSPQELEIFDPLLVQLLQDISIVSLICQNWIRGDRKVGYMGHMAKMVAVISERRRLSGDNVQRLLASMIRNAEAKLDGEERERWSDLVSVILPRLSCMSFSVLPSPTEFDGSMKSVETEEASGGDADYKPYSVDDDVQRVVVDFSKMMTKQGDDEDEIYHDDEDAEDARNRFEEMCAMKYSGEEEDAGIGSAGSSSAERISVNALDLAQQDDVPFAMVSPDFELVAGLSEGHEDLRMAAEDPWSANDSSESRSFEDGWADFTAFPAVGNSSGGESWVFKSDLGGNQSSENNLEASSASNQRSWAEVAAFRSAPHQPTDEPKVQNVEGVLESGPATENNESAGVAAGSGNIPAETAEQPTSSDAADS